MMFWMPVVVLLALVLAAAAWHDRRTRARGQVLATDMGARVARKPSHGHADAHRGADSLNPNTGRGMGL
ncbi:hypothetical protein GB931_15635 [Modestobacter sp. I12A-02628]|uniref:Uncharacterized protein n=1 Tax=Goekera deserti TaxID=2497753 RepID=A0A7K3WJ08_9ACTN|nr:hypothetical protein [Goekera deserti]MPQ99322.1 hypothetical protein [Goekera deserti]NDI50321.1 hypothetical protein [Goekera deserti]NEL56427.1 hypothetical protein [Goekera deserti]